MRIIRTILLALAVIALLGGCANTRFISSVNALAKTNAQTLKRYVLLPGTKEIDAEDLEFQEFSAYVDKVLTKKGLIKVGDVQASEIIVFLSYSIGDPQTTKTRLRTKTTFNRFVVLSALDTQRSIKEQKHVQVWQVSAFSKGTYGDLRLAFPHMLTAMAPYVGGNTEHTIQVEVPINAEEVQSLRNSLKIR